MPWMTITKHNKKSPRIAGKRYPPLPRIGVSGGISKQKITRDLDYIQVGLCLNTVALDSTGPSSLHKMNTLYICIDTQCGKVFGNPHYITIPREVKVYRHSLLEL